MVAEPVIKLTRNTGKTAGTTMNRKSKTATLIALFFIMAPIIGTLPISAFDVITIVDEVNDANQIISDGEIYGVNDTPQGDDLVKNYMGQKVKVTGKMRIEGDMRIIDVRAIEFVEE
jgi:hypothetical protein